MRISPFALAAMAVVLLAPGAPAQDGSSSVRFAWLRMQERNQARAEAARQAEQQATAQRREHFVTQVRARRERWAASQQHKLAMVATRRAVVAAHMAAKAEASEDSTTPVRRRRRHLADETASTPTPGADLAASHRRRIRRPGAMDDDGAKTRFPRAAVLRARRDAWAADRRHAASPSSQRAAQIRRYRATRASPTPSPQAPAGRSSRHR